MESEVVPKYPPEPPGSSVCWLVGFVELATILTIFVGVLGSKPADRNDSVSDLPAVATLDYVEHSSESLTAAEEELGSLTDVEKSMLGTWEDDYKGHRILTLNAGGTGTMVVELDGLAATLFAKTLTFREEWSVVDGKVTMKATGGEPAGKVGLVLSLHGDSSTQRIVEVTADRMILVEEPSETRFEWRRVPVAESPSR